MHWRRCDQRGRLLSLAALLCVTNPGYATIGAAEDWIDKLLSEVDAMHVKS